jgi:hypothetical protein
MIPFFITSLASQTTRTVLPNCPDFIPSPCITSPQHLVTCQSQPALGCVYKLVEINDQPRIKLSQEVEKLVIPCRKNVYRLLGADGKPLVDILQMAGEQPPVVGVRILCRHPFMENKRAYVTPSAIVPLLNLVWDGPNGGQKVSIKPLKEVRLTAVCVSVCVRAVPSLYAILYCPLLCVTQFNTHSIQSLTLHCNVHLCLLNRPEITADSR